MQLISASSEQKIAPSLIDPFKSHIDTQLRYHQKPSFQITALELLKKRVVIEQNSIVLQIQEQIKLLEDMYIFDSLKEGETFLLNNQYLIDILFEAREEIRRIFGYVIELHLELHHDPEEDFEELFIVIRSPYSPEEARKLMDKLGEQWFLDMIEKVQGKLCITEEPL